MNLSLRVALLSAAGAALACGGGDLSLPTGAPARMESLAGNGQTGTAGAPLAESLVVRVTDADGAGVANVEVTWAADGGGSVDPTTSMTDADGRAGTRRVLGAEARAYTTTATADVPEGSPVVFVATATAGAPASIAPSTGEGQSATVGTAVPVPPAVLLRDAAGNPVPNVMVTFAVTAGAGTISGASPVSNGDGVATLGSWTLGTAAGVNRLEASVAGTSVEGNPVAFRATATPGGPSADRSTVEASPGLIDASTGASQATVTVAVHDPQGNPVPGVSVTLSATGSGNTVTQPGAATDASGSTTGRFSSTGAGDHVISATAAGVKVTQSATVRVRPGPIAPSRTAVTVPNGAAGSTTTITVQLRDQFGNAVTGMGSVVEVSVDGANSAGTLSIAEASGGQYRATYVPTEAGGDLVRVRVAGAAVPGSPFTSTVVAGPADPTRTAVSVCTPIVGATGRVRVETGDAYGNRLGRGGDQVSATVLRGSSRTAVTMTDHGDGTYSGTFSGPFDDVAVEVLLNGTAVTGSPFGPIRQFLCS